MEPAFWLLMVLSWVTFAVAMISTHCAYRNGVTDGYGYAKEPGCPGYRAAGEYLKKRMAHRWPELKSQPQKESQP
jgi:hypothetical protein